MDDPIGLVLIKQLLAKGVLVVEDICDMADDLGANSHHEAAFQVNLAYVEYSVGDDMAEPPVHHIRLVHDGGNT